MLPEPKLYKMRVTHAGGLNNEIVATGDSVSDAVEQFLQKYLQNGKIAVEIFETSRITRKV
jgi:hypothetical protein